MDWIFLYMYVCMYVLLVSFLFGMNMILNFLVWAHFAYHFIDLWHRLGYDYAGGYEREMGGRHGYADERPHGRYMGRSSGGFQSGPSSGNCSTFFLIIHFFH